MTTGDQEDQEGQEETGGQEIRRSGDQEIRSDLALFTLERVRAEYD
jgi:hypothetical protein